MRLIPPPALLLLSLALSAQTPDPICFTLRVDSKFNVPGSDLSEEHHFVESYRPPRAGDLGIYRPGEKLTCSVVSLQPGDSRRFFLAAVHGTASGRSGTQSATAEIHAVSDQNRQTGVFLTRTEKGGTLEFSAASPIESTNQDVITGCDGSWDTPQVFEFTEQELLKLPSVSKSLSLRMTAGPANGCSGTASVTLNATLPPADEEMVLEPGDAYNSWLPAPQAKDMPGVTFDASVRLPVKARILPKKAGSEAREAKIRFSLEQVSRHSGRCGNFPKGGQEKDDLRFSSEQPEGIVVSGKTATTTEKVTEATVYIEATDFAAWGKVTAEAPDLSLRALHKPTNKYSVTIPRDEDENKIADAWEGSSRLEPSADDEDVPGQQSRGDGLTAASEYRGFVVLENGARVHKRLDPRRKDLFIVDAGGSFDTALWANLSGITAWKLDDSLIQGGSDRRQSRIVNFLPGADSRHKFAVRLETVSGLADPDKPSETNGPLGYTDEWPIRSPADAIVCRVFKDRINSVITGLYNWLANALKIPNSKEAAELASSGYPRFLAERAFAQLGPGQRENLARKLTLLASIHEVGHACGLPGHVNSKGEEGSTGSTACPMRYMTLANATQLMLLQTLFAPGAPLPGEVSRFCSTEFNCYRQLNVKD